MRTTRVGDVEVRTFWHQFSNAHVVTRGNASVLVDSGYGQDAPALDKAMRKAGVDPKTLRAIVVTHAHADHAGGASWFHDHYGTRIVAGAADRADFASGHNGKLCPVGFLGKVRRAHDQAGTFTPITDALWIDTPTQLGPLIGFDALIEPHPSHTPGSLVLLTGEAAFVGDQFRGSAVGHSAELHFFTCDVRGTRADITRLLAGSDARVFFPGHFAPVARDSVETLR